MTVPAPQTQAELDQWCAGVMFALQAVRRAASQMAAELDQLPGRAESSYCDGYNAALDGIEGMCNKLLPMMAERGPECSSS